MLNAVAMRGGSHDIVQDGDSRSIINFCCMSLVSPVLRPQYLNTPISYLTLITTDAIQKQNQLLSTYSVCVEGLPLTFIIEDTVTF